MNDKPTLLTIKQAGELLGVTPLTLRNWDKKGKLTALRHPINNYRVYRRSDIEKLISEIESNTTAFIRPHVKQIKKGPKKLQVKHLD